MVILCNADEAAAERYLIEDQDARRHMRAAADAMLECSKTAKDAETAARYDAAHKKMVRLMRDWNRLEQEREVPPAGVKMRVFQSFLGRLR